MGLAACGAATAAGPSVRASATVRPAQCAPQAPRQIGFNSWSAARTQLAPPGPSAIRLCRYGGLNASPPRRLQRSVQVTVPSTLARIVGRFDRLPPAMGTYGCPLDDGSEIVALLAYPHGHHVTIAVRLRGCQTVTNGDLVRIAAGTGGQPGPQLVAELERLTA